MNLVLVGFAIVASRLQESLFFASILKKVFLYEKTEEEIKKDRKDKSLSLKSQNSKVSSMSEKGLSEKGGPRDTNNEESFNASIGGTQQPNIGGRNYLEVIMMQLTKRTNFISLLGERVRFHIGIYCKRCYKHKKYITQKHELFRIGIKKIGQELDITHLIEKQRISTLMA